MLASGNIGIGAVIAVGFYAACVGVALVGMWLRRRNRQ